MEGFEIFDYFEDVIFGLFAAENIYAPDGTLLIAEGSLIITQDSLVSLAALDADGRGRFEGELPFALYYVQELQTAPGFILDNTRHPVDARYTGQDNAVIRVVLNNGEPIVNERMRGELRILKMDSITRAVLQGARFGLYQDGERIAEAVTNEDGYAFFEDLPFGEYQVRELEAPAGYVLLDYVYTIVIREHGQRVLLEVLNAPEVPEIPECPEQPEVPETPECPEIPEVPECPERPECPGEPETPETPEEPECPEQPEDPYEPEDPEQPDEPYIPDIPKTGDNPRPLLMVGVILLAAGGAAALLWLKKKKEDRNAQ